MTKLFLSFLVATLLSITALSANCGMKGMHKEKCDKPNCEMKMKKADCKMQNCKMDKKAEKCKCGMNKADCKMPSCKMDMKKSASCGAGKCGADMMKKSDEMSGKAGKKMSGSCGAGKCGADMMKKAKCDCKNGGECKCKAAGKECKCNIEPAKKAVEKCGCGMTVESCKKMMISCKFRDAREAKEAQNK